MPKFETRTDFSPQLYDHHWGTGAVGHLDEMAAERSIAQPVEP
jgi:hypothetical protein